MAPFVDDSHVKHSRFLHGTLLDHQRQLTRVGEDIDGETDPATQRLAHHSSMLNIFERSILFQGVLFCKLC